MPMLTVTPAASASARIAGPPTAVYVRMELAPYEASSVMLAWSVCVTTPLRGHTGQRQCHKAAAACLQGWRHRTSQACWRVPVSRAPRSPRHSSVKRHANAVGREAHLTQNGAGHPLSVRYVFVGPQTAPVVVLNLWLPDRTPPRHSTVSPGVPGAPVQRLEPKKAGVGSSAAPSAPLLHPAASANSSAAGARMAHTTLVCEQGNRRRGWGSGTGGVDNCCGMSPRRERLVKATSAAANRSLSSSVCHVAATAVTTAATTAAPTSAAGAHASRTSSACWSRGTNSFSSDAAAASGAVCAHHGDQPANASCWRGERLGIGGRAGLGLHRRRRLVVLAPPMRAVRAQRAARPPLRLQALQPRAQPRRQPGFAARKRQNGAKQPLGAHPAAVGAVRARRGGGRGGGGRQPLRLVRLAGCAVPAAARRCAGGGGVHRHQRLRNKQRRQRGAPRQALMPRSDAARAREERPSSSSRS